MTKADMEQIILAIAQLSILSNQFFLSNKMKEGMLRIANNKDKVNDIYSQLEEIKSYFVVIDDKLTQINDRLNS